MPLLTSQCGRLILTSPTSILSVLLCWTCLLGNGNLSKLHYKTCAKPFLLTCYVLAGTEHATCTFKVLCGSRFVSDARNRWGFKSQTRQRSRGRFNGASMIRKRYMKNKLRLLGTPPSLYICIGSTAWVRNRREILGMSQE
jgi:hypothetical protein